MRYSDEILNEVRENSDIVEVISQYVHLKRSGRNYFGLCPFHNEKSPSFSVSPDKQIFHCFGCGVGGNVFTFISKIEGIGFKEAIENLADRAGIVLPKSTNNEDSRKEELKSKVYKVNNFTADYYHKRLYKPESKAGQEYVKQRKLTNETLESYNLGFSGNYDELYKILRKEGFNDEEILESGLVKKNEYGQYVDFYRDRFMIPILDVRNRVIAFGGRVLGDAKRFKYLNSPENIVYSKGKHLFGLNVAKRYDHKKLLIVEGYMDAISLHQRGITNVVAALGTALTTNQGWLLRRNAEQVILGFDADGAGQNAIMRAMEVMQNMGCDMRVLQMTGAKDPDEFVVKYGPDKFKYYIMQDYLYLKEYAKVFAIGVAKAKTLETANLFAKYIAVMNGELDVHSGYMGKFNVSQEEIDDMKPSLDNLSYTSYMLRVAYEEGEAEILAAILSCAYSYEVIAKKIVENNPNSINDEFYGDWIKGYASNEYASGNIILIETMNQLTKDYTEKQIQHLIDIFVVCSRYELAFWQMSWDKSC